MMAVDHEEMDVSVSVADPRCTDEMRVVHGKGVVDMLDFLGIVHRPNSRGDQDGGGGNHPKHGKSRRQTDLGSKPSGQRIGDQPAGMRQSELRGEERGSVFWMRRTAQQAAGWRLRKRIADADCQLQRQQQSESRYEHADEQPCNENGGPRQHGSAVWHVVEQSRQQQGGNH